MYHHILVPTDGTDLSRRAVERSLELAKELGAKVTAVRVSGKPAQLVVLGVNITDLPEETRQRISKEIADHLAWVEGEAAARGVACEAIRVESEQTWKGILETAEASAAAISLPWPPTAAPGVTAKLLGSETQKVLTHSRIPVLVYR